MDIEFLENKILKLERGQEELYKLLKVLQDDYNELKQNANKKRTKKTKDEVCRYIPQN